MPTQVLTKNIENKLITGLDYYLDQLDRFTIYQNFKIQNDLQEKMLPFAKWTIKSSCYGVTMHTYDEIVLYLAKIRKTSKENVKKTSTEFIKNYYLWYLTKESLQEIKYTPSSLIK